VHGSATVVQHGVTFFALLSTVSSARMPNTLPSTLMTDGMRPVSWGRSVQCVVLAGSLVFSKERTVQQTAVAGSVDRSVCPDERRHVDIDAVSSLEKNFLRDFLYTNLIMVFGFSFCTLRDLLWTRCKKLLVSEKADR